MIVNKILFVFLMIIFLASLEGCSYLQPKQSSMEIDPYGRFIRLTPYQFGNEEISYVHKTQWGFLQTNDNQTSPTVLNEEFGITYKSDKSIWSNAFVSIGSVVANIFLAIYNFK